MSYTKLSNYSDTGILNRANCTHPRVRKKNEKFLLIFFLLSFFSDKHLYLHFDCLSNSAPRDNFRWIPTRSFCNWMAPRFFFILAILSLLPRRAAFEIPFLEYAREFIIEIISFESFELFFFFTLISIVR